MTTYKERSNYGGELEVQGTHDGKLHIEITDSSHDTYDFLVERFDQPMIALDILGPRTDDAPAWTPDLAASDDTLVMIARDVLTALRERRAEAARQEEVRKEELVAINARLEGQPLSLTQPLGPQLHALGFRLAVIGGAA